MAILLCCVIFATRLILFLYFIICTNGNSGYFYFRKTLVEQDQQYSKLSTTELVKDDNVTSKLSSEQAITEEEFSNEQTEADTESTTTEIPCLLAESKDDSTRVKLAEVKDEISTNITNKPSNWQAQSEDNVEATFPNESTKSEGQGTTTKLPREIAEDEGKIKVIKQTKIEDTVIITEPQIKKQVVVEGNNMAIRFECVGEQKIKNDAKNMPAHEQTEAEKKHKIQIPGFPKNMLMEGEDKDTTSKLLCDLEVDESKSTVTKLTNEQAGTEDKIVSTESPHEQMETEGKIKAVKHIHKQIHQAEVESINKLQEEYFALENITKLLYDAFRKKGKTVALIDEKKKKYEVDFKIQDFLVDNGNFESELEKDIEILSQLLRQKEADKDGAIKESDQLMSQLNDQNVQLKKINEELDSKSTLKVQLENKLSSLSNTINKLEKEIQVGKTNIAKMVKAMEANQCSIAKCEEQLKADTTRNLELCDKKSTAEKGLEKAMESVQELHKTMEKINEELQNIKVKISDHKERQTEMQKDLYDIKTNHSKSTKEMEKMKCNLNETKSRYENSKMKLNQMQSLLDNVAAEIEESCNQKSKFQKVSDENSKKLMQLQEKLDEHSKNIKKCKEEILSLQKNAFEFQERNDMLIVSCKACVKLTIKEMEKKLKKGSLKNFFETWNSQIESLQKELSQLSKRFEEHIEVIEVHSVTSVNYKPVQVIENIEMGYLQSLGSTTKKIYVLRATIQHCIYQINLDDLINSFCGKCNEIDEHDEDLACTENEKKVGGTTTKTPCEIAAAEGKIKIIKLPYKQAETKGKIPTDLLHKEQSNGEKATAKVLHDHTNTYHKTMIDLATCAKENRLKLLDICKDIDNSFMKLNNARICHEKCVSNCILQQISSWEEMQEPIKLFSQSLIDIETMIGTQEIAKVICHIDDGAGKIDSTEKSSIDTEELQKLNKFHCSRNVTSIVDSQLTSLNKINEELKSSNAANDHSVTMMRELEQKEIEMHQLEVEMQQIQKRLDSVQKEIEMHQQLQEEIQRKEVLLSELNKVLSCQQQDAQLKQSELDKIATKTSQKKQIQDTIETCNNNLAEHSKKLEGLQQQLDELQLQSQKHEFGGADDSINDTKEKFLIERISEAQSTIRTIKEKCCSYEKELAELHETEEKELELLNVLSSLQKEISRHQVTIESIKLSINKTQKHLDRNPSVLKEYKEEEVNLKDKLLNLSNMLSKNNIKFIETFVDYTVEIIIQKVVQIEENELKIKTLNQYKSNLLSHGNISERKSLADKQVKFEQQLHSLDEELREKYKVLKMHQDSLEFNQKEFQQIEDSSRSVSDKLEEACAKHALKQEEKLKIQANQQTEETELQKTVQLENKILEKLANCKRALAQLKSKQQQLVDKISNHKDEISKLETKEQEVKKCLDEHKVNKSSLDKERRKLDAELKSIKSDLVRIDDTISKQTSALNDHKERKENLITEHSNLQKQISKTREIIKQSEEERKTVNETSQLNVREIKTLNIKKKETENTLTKTGENYSVSLKQKEKTQEEYDEVKAKFVDIECIQKQKEELYCTLEKLKVQLNEVKQNEGQRYDRIRGILKTMLCTLEQVDIQANKRLVYTIVCR